MDLPVHTIAKDALDTFPPVGTDRDAASNYAQRMLTQHFAEIRKSGQSISDEEMQEQRQALNRLIDTLDVTANPVLTSTPDNDDTKKEEPGTPLHTQQLEAIISACFHTATDGSPEHLAVLRRRAVSALTQYLSDANLGWTEKRRLKSKGKRLIDMHMKDISKGSGDAL